MVCIAQAITFAKNDQSTSAETKSSIPMDFQEDRLELQRLAGGNIVKYPPVFSENGCVLFVRCDNVVQVYSTNTGELARELRGASGPLIGLQLELKQPDILVGCSVSGEIYRWHWRTGVLQKTIKLNLVHERQVTSFNLLNLYKTSDTACAWITMKTQESNVSWAVVDTTTGKKIHVTSNLLLKMKIPIVDVGVKDFKYIVMAQGFYIYFLNYTNWKYVRYKNANLVPITSVRFNPVEEMVATGDEHGRVFLWRLFDNQKNMRNVLYHWHHTAVTSIAFSASGTSFYSSGHESVLLKWNVKNPQLREFLPRMSSIIKHIVVSDGNEHVVVCTEDNSLQFLGASDNALKSTVQNFTYAPDDKTGRSKFPIGMLLNPRSNTLVLNGRTGHLQFYSAYTKNLLYNLAVVSENKLSMEAERILYNIQVTKAAFNIDWMATGEVFNDEEHMPVLYLKFWKYHESMQRYKLNTNVELPHEGGFKAIAFSNAYQVDNLHCVTVGHDNIIKMWGLEDSMNIRRKEKVWSCLTQTSYKQLTIESVSFSQDGSLLAAGYGNTLCIFKSDTLKLRAALTSAAGLDGVVAKAQVHVAMQTMNGAKNEYLENRNALWKLIKSGLESNDKNFNIAELQALLTLGKTTAQSVTTCRNLKPKSKEEIFAKISKMPELNLYQKLQLYQKLGIRCKVHNKWQNEMIRYLRQTIAEPDTRLRTRALDMKLSIVNVRQRYKAKYRLQHYIKRKQHFDKEIADHLVPIMSMLSLSTLTKPTTIPEKKQKKLASPSKEKFALPPVQISAQITHVQFAAGDYAHLVAVCTESRVLIWNLLTLRLQSVLKLSVRHLAFDPQTNLLAAVNKQNELHVFQPNVPLPIYQRANMPHLFGLIWLPRRAPRQRSINVDWQAQSTLYFLTETQQIKYLATSDAADIDEQPAPVSFTSSAAAETLRYTTFGTFATQQTSAKRSGLNRQNGPLIVGKGRDSNVGTLVELSSHTMPPLSLLCGEFIKSLLNPAESASINDQSRKNNNTIAITNGLNGHHSTSDDDEDMAEDKNNDGAVTMKSIDDVASNGKTTFEIRRNLIETSEALTKFDDEKTLQNIESQLERIGQLSFKIDF